METHPIPTPAPCSQPPPLVSPGSCNLARFLLRRVQCPLPTVLSYKSGFSFSSLSSPNRIPRIKPSRIKRLLSSFDIWPPGPGTGGGYSAPPPLLPPAAAITGLLITKLYVSGGSPAQDFLGRTSVLRQKITMANNLATRQRKYCSMLTNVPAVQSVSIHYEILLDYLKLLLYMFSSSQNMQTPSASQYWPV